MLRIMRDENLLLPLRQAIADGLPVFGTCAGMILLASHVDNDDRERLATMDITVMRNAYGRQLGSFYTEAPFKGITEEGETVPMTFISQVWDLRRQPSPLSTATSSQHGRTASSYARSILN